MRKIPRTVASTRRKTATTRTISRSFTAKVTTSCHCGAVRIEVDRKPRRLTACNCSICRRYAAHWAYYTRPSVRVTAARGNLERYSWGGHRLEFHRCAQCGCVMFHEWRKKAGDATRLGVNMRMADEPAALARVRIRLLDGARTWKFLD